MMLNLYKLEIFNAVAAEGSFSKAADRLLLSQPAVSQHIRDLENSLQATLFIRGSRGVRLTPAGEILLEHTRLILNKLAEAESAISQLKKFENVSLYIGATPGVGTNLLPGWIQEYKSRYPSARITLRTDTTSTIAQEILAKRLEAGFVEGELESSPPIQSLHLRDIKMYVMTARDHPWAGRESIPLSALDGAPFIARPKGSHTRAWIDKVFLTHTITPDFVAEFDRPEAIIAAVASGLGVTILPEWGLDHSAERQLVHLRIEGLSLKRTLKLVWSEDFPPKPAVRTFLQLLAGEFPQLAELFPL
jgi:LysR family transcriptional regulator, transcriptional activator of the cysJI operon